VLLTAVLDAMEKRKICPLRGIKPQNNHQYSPKRQTEEE
jgi:hypothetical protein